MYKKCDGMPGIIGKNTTPIQFLKTTLSVAAIAIVARPGGGRVSGWWQRQGGGEGFGDKGMGERDARRRRPAVGEAAELSGRVRTLACRR